MQNEHEKTIISVLDDNKALNIQHIDVQHLTDISDSIIICTATSNRHAKTLADKVSRESKNHSKRPLSMEGLEDGQWILIDYGDTIVHIMLESIREFYSLEKLWVMTESNRQKNSQS